MKPERSFALLLPVLSAFLLASCGPSDAADAPESTAPPTFQSDPSWPVDIPAHWVNGPGTGVWVDGQDHVWVLHRPERITDVDMDSVSALRADVPECCVKAQPLYELGTDGRIIQTVGSIEKSDEWPFFPHSVFLDHNDNLWIASQPHHVIMKLTRDGKHLLSIGEFDKTEGSASTTLLGGPADMFVDAEANELFVADGYQNARVVVFDAETGAYKRHWGAYGVVPDDDYVRDSTSTEPPKQFNLVHGLNISKDGLVYVTDASNSRLQVFRKNGEFIAEAVVDPANSAGGRMTDVAFSGDPEQSFVYLADGTSHKIWILRRSDLTVVGAFGEPGTGPGQFGRPHNIATDSHGNIYVAEAHPGRRWQKLTAVQPTP